MYLQIYLHPYLQIYLQYENGFDLQIKLNYVDHHTANEFAVTGANKFATTNTERY
jgi:hypothetical protein